MAVLDAQGAVVTIENVSSVATTIGEVKSFDFGDGAAADIDITTLSSTAKEYRQGLQDNGDLTMELNRDPSDAGQIVLLEARAAQATREITITLASGDVATFDAYVKSVSTGGAVDDVVVGTATLKITGNVVWS